MSTFGGVTQPEEWDDSDRSEPERTYPPLPREHWRDRAKCRDENPALFFPIPCGNRLSGSRGHVDPYAAGRIICRSCPVTAECLDYALTTRQDQGLWGGRDEFERHEIIRRRRAKR